MRKLAKKKMKMKDLLFKLFIAFSVMYTFTSHFSFTLFILGQVFH